MKRMDTRKLKKHGSILCTLAVLAVVSSLPAASSRILERPDLLKRVRAWSAGATLVAADAAVMQTRRNDCGPAALKMVLDAHNRGPLKALSEEVGLTGGGVSAASRRSPARPPIAPGLSPGTWRASAPSQRAKNTSWSSVLKRAGSGGGRPALVEWPGSSRIPQDR